MSSSSDSLGSIRNGRRRAVRHAVKPPAREIQAGQPQQRNNLLKRTDKSTAIFALADCVALHPKRFVFFDRKTGARRFEVEATPDGRMPREQAASLLAMHCVARQLSPKDFSVMVAVGEDLVEGLIGGATKLIRSCGDSLRTVPLSRRQYEVLSAVAQNMSNKEIAGRLNLSERTVKFHVSALLEKFAVRGRVDLMLETTNLLPQEVIHKRHGDSQGRGMSEVRTIPLLPAANGRSQTIAGAGGPKPGVR
jgi:DNA-binding CsgD family transcriptional regulator